ncbi:MAG TPA: hypothetical protein VMF51_02890 [Nocardioides sp.]|uniref:DUF7144 family membrane protein n=1 Tax=Nocardioides sp. TaxID=35761 RepID=UPI002C23C8CF|nr:hypothetical protein [Nocardioides sp.]HTW14045.1 hypothetical protein [Nocardioides sp.]
MTTHASGRAYEKSTKGLVAVGTTAFAGVMLATVAIFQILQGIAALAEDTVFVSGAEYTYEFDVTAWGWIHLVVGIIALLTGIGILGGQRWAMLAGIAIATLAAITNFAFMPYYPFWTIVVLAFNVFVIWALCNQIMAADRAAGR